LIERTSTHGCVVSWLLMHTGEQDMGSALLQKTITFMDKTLPAAIEHSDRQSPELCYLTSGDVEKALQSIETQLSHNHLWGWDITHQLPMYDLIRFDPRYQAALAERAQRIDVMREAIAEIDAEAGP
jgi:hypothetical protein